MEETKHFPSLIKITAIFAIVALTILYPINTQGTGQVTQSAVRHPSESGANERLPTEILAALSLAHGDYRYLIDPEDLMNDLQSADIVLIGEAHHDQLDMQTAFEITRLLAQRRSIALAVERFPLSLQTRLDALNRMNSKKLRQEALRKILQDDEYKTVWKPDTINSPYLPNPSTGEFERMMLWAAQEQIPIIGLDLPLSERSLGFGDDIPYRNELWKDQIVNFLDKNQSDDYLVIAIGGIDHFNNAADSVQAKIQKYPSNYTLLSIGQRDANYSTGLSLQVENLAKTYQINDLILQSPQFAVVKQDGVAIFPTPPDYWITVHSVDSWEKN